MGVDFYSCNKCSYVFSDHDEEYTMCDCGKKWCSVKCSEDEGYDKELDNCSHCRGEIEKMVTITQKEYAQLLDDSRKLEALENGGVDNWSSYGQAMSEYYDNDEDEDEEE